MRGRHSPPAPPFSWSLTWAVVCWLALAKPWFFTGPYLNRLPLLEDAREAISLVRASDAVLTTSYLVPQLSQRPRIAFPKKGAEQRLVRSPWTVLLLHPGDPGWGSSSGRQRRLIRTAKDNGWRCRAWPSGLTLCRHPESMLSTAGQRRRPDSAPGDSDRIEPDH